MIVFDYGSIRASMERRTDVQQTVQGAIASNEQRFAQWTATRKELPMHAYCIVGSNEKIHIRGKA